jgi:hypothetical protein
MIWIDGFFIRGKQKTLLFCQKQQRFLMCAFTSPTEEYTLILDTHARASAETRSPAIFHPCCPDSRFVRHARSVASPCGVFGGHRARSSRRVLGFFCVVRTKPAVSQETAGFVFR